MKNIAILFGGYSSEYGVSLQSAYAVIRNLNREKYCPILIGISPDGDWYHYTGSLEKILQDTWCNPQDCQPVTLSVSRSCPAILCGKQQIHIDAVFPVLHGKNGEDGTVQGLFSLAGVPVVGCSVLASALCMDKARAHALVAAEGIPVPKSIVLHRPDAQAQALSYPLFVKPVKSGSSYGITKVADETHLQAAIDLAFQYDDTVILEQAIGGFEVGCALIGGLEPVAGAVDEITLSGGFFDFTEKYTLKTSAIHVPARICPEKAAEIQQTAKRVYRILGCTGFARVDFFLTPEGSVVFNEVNTIPGFTEHSRFPSMMRCAGISFTEVLERILQEALAR